MTLPPTFYFLKPGWWVLHLAAPALIFGGGIGLGIYHARGHGQHEAIHRATTHAAAASTSTGNALKDEMADLQVAYNKLNEGVILGRTDGIIEAFHAVHLRREATEKALEAGTVVPPKNADKLDAFKERDAAFHAILEGTLDAVGKNDLPALAARSDELRTACVACHAEYR